jgi:hypothetical protein
VRAKVLLVQPRGEPAHQLAHGVAPIVSARPARKRADRILRSDSYFVRLSDSLHRDGKNEFSDTLAESKTATKRTHQLLTV